MKADDDRFSVPAFSVFPCSHVRHIISFFKTCLYFPPLTASYTFTARQLFVAISLNCFPPFSIEFSQVNFTPTPN